MAIQKYLVLSNFIKQDFLIHNFEIPVYILKNLFLWILVAFDCFKNFEQKHTETHRNSTQPMSRQTKTPSFLRNSAIFETTVQFPVNPYVVGSSPTARAKDFQGFQTKAFFL